jgi:uncharacterized protein YjiK
MNRRPYYFIILFSPMNILLMTFLFFPSCSDAVSDEIGQNSHEFTDYSVLINEFMVSQESTLTDPDFSEYSGWIELYNREDTDIDISGWIVAGDSPESNPDLTHTLPSETIIPANGFLLIWTDGKDTVDDAIHTRFSLSEDGGIVGLYGPGDTGFPVVDTISYQEHDVAADISIGRMNFDGHDHTGFILPMNHPTPGQANRLAELPLRKSFPLDIEDPSGLGVDHSGNYLWTVSDIPGGSIYKITKTGTIVDELPVKGDDMEGITQHPENHLLYVAEEKLRHIVRYDTLGNKIKSDSVEVDIEHINRGLEGITINPKNGHVFVVNKKVPRVLIELDLSKEQEHQQIRYTPVDFGAGHDAEGLSLSGLFFDEQENVLWVVSDRASAVFILDLFGRPLAALDAGQEDLEAIALIREENRIYLVSDELRTLFVYEYPENLSRLPVSN